MGLVEGEGILQRKYAQSHLVYDVLIAIIYNYNNALIHITMIHVNTLTSSTEISCESISTLADIDLGGQETLASIVTWMHVSA